MRGKAAVRTVSGAAIVALDENGDGYLDRMFTIQDSSLELAPVGLSATRAHILSWPGHLVVIAPGPGKALHFSLTTEAKLALPGNDVGSWAVPDPAELDTILLAHYELGRFDTATSIGSRWGRMERVSLDQIAGWSEERLRDLVPASQPSIIPQNPTPDPGGLGTCGTSCTQTCGDGSHCSISCPAPRCATCGCPNGADCHCT